MEDYKSFLELDNQGSVLFIFADKYQINLVYEDIEDDQLYVFQMDKGFIISAVQCVKMPDNLKASDVDWKRWFIPRDTRSINFSGLADIDGALHRFRIDESAILSFREEDHNDVVPHLFDSIDRKSLSGISVDHFVVKQEKLHVVGFDTDSQEQVYCVINTNNDSCLKKYRLHSGVGDIKVNAITVDPCEKRVYLGGEINRYDAEDVYLYSTPYVESFLN